MTLLVPERMLVFSPALAATIGLEEAVLLHALHDLSVCLPGDRRWYEVDVGTLERLLPFWDCQELQRVSKNLADKGVLHLDSPPLTSATTLRYCFKLEAPVAARPFATRPDVRVSPAPLRNADSGGASLLARNWRPKDDTLRMLEMSRSVPRDFAIEQIEDFVFYWRERGEVRHAWDNDFRKYVIEQWQRQLQRSAEKDKPRPAELEDAWYPSPDCLQILERSGISREFIDDAVPEFVLYWRERGTSDGTWNSKFIAHIRRQWARYENALEHELEPRPISTSWQPSEDVYDILRMANIDIAFACELLPEFILFWRDAGTPHRSWNTKFLQHVKYQWATRHHLTSQRGLTQGVAQAPVNAFERLTDRSWAAGLIDGL